VVDRVAAVYVAIVTNVVGQQTICQSEMLYEMASYLSITTVCRVCLKEVVNKGVECEGICKRWLHPDCVKLPTTEYKNIADGVVKSWHCKRIDCVYDEVDPSMKIDILK